MIAIFGKNEDIANFHYAIICDADCGNRKTSKELSKEFADIAAVKEIIDALGAAEMAALGAAVGSVIPVVGTAVGTAVGAIVGFISENWDSIEKYLFPMLEKRIPSKNVSARMLRSMFASSNLSTVDAIPGESGGFAIINDIVDPDRFTGIISNFVAELQNTVAGGRTWDQLCQSDDSNRRHLWQTLSTIEVARINDISAGNYGLKKKFLGLFGYDEENGTSLEFEQARQAERERLQGLTNDWIDEDARNQDPPDDPRSGGQTGQPGTPAFKGKKSMAGIAGIAVLLLTLG